MVLGSDWVPGMIGGSYHREPLWQPMSHGETRDLIDDFSILPKVVNLTMIKGKLGRAQEYMAQLAQ